MGQVMARVGTRFPEAGPAEIRKVVEQVHHQYDGRPIREFVPVLVEREVTDTLHLARQHRSSEALLTGERELLTS
jgi:hypothetical protein